MNATQASAQDQQQYWQSLAQQIIEPARAAPMIYADWTASGRLFAPIEQRLSYQVGGFMANTHTEDSMTGRTMTGWLKEANQRIKNHVGANDGDVLLCLGSGMTAALAKLIRLMGWWCHEDFKTQALQQLQQRQQRPLVYITHREHHSNQTMWLESLAEVRLIPALVDDVIDLQWLRDDLAQETSDRPKVASVTAASNVTGVFTPYHDIAGILHDHGGLCFVDFAASAPYVDIDMHPNARESLDAIFFSPHKFLGGPGSQGVLIFDSKMYRNRVPELPGGGTVVWTNPWGEHRFVENIEERENAGTPGILQTLRTAMAIQLKEEMGVAAMSRQKKLLNDYFFTRLEKIPQLNILASQHRDRLSIFSIVFEKIPYKTAVRQLSDLFGIQARGGCACAGTYGHFLLGIDRCTSARITAELERDADADKPGWVRISLHPSMSLATVGKIADAVVAIAAGIDASKDVGRETSASHAEIRPNIWSQLSTS